MVFNKLSKIEKYKENKQIKNFENQVNGYARFLNFLVETERVKEIGKFPRNPEGIHVLEDFSAIARPNNKETKEHLHNVNNQYKKFREIALNSQRERISLDAIFLFKGIENKKIFPRKVNKIIGREYERGVDKNNYIGALPAPISGTDKSYEKSRLIYFTDNTLESAIEEFDREIRFPLKLKGLTAFNIRKKTSNNREGKTYYQADISNSDGKLLNPPKDVLFRKLFKHLILLSHIMKTKIFLSILILFFLIAPIVNAALPPTTIYKTKANYNDLVPVGLSEDNSKIMSYPGPGDVYYKGELAYPTELSQGYLLDNRGVGPNSAFLDITYEKYSQLDEIPSHEEFFDMIKDYDPFLEMYDCGNRPSDETEWLNTIINQGKLNEVCVSLLEQSGPTPEPEQSYLIYWIIGIAVIVVVILYLILRKKK